MNTVQTVPNIQQAPRSVNDTAIHYGYCAFQDIKLTGSLGHEHYVQPPDSPYYQVLPAGELIPFTNIEITEQRSTGTQTNMRFADKFTWQKVPKTAKECVEEMESSAEDWGFTGLKPLIGVPEDEAFHVFQTIQPFLYNFKHLPYALEDAEDRIEQTAPYTVTFGADTLDLQPLPAHLKQIARDTLELMKRSAKTGIDYAQEIMDKTEVSLVNSFSGGTGKRTADPRDKFVFAKFEREIPKLLDNKPQYDQTGNAGGMSADEMKLRRDEFELKKEELALRKAELAAKNGGPKVYVPGLITENADGVLSAPAIEIKQKCGDTGGRNAQGEPCKVNATNNGRCANHQVEEKIAA